MQCQKRSDYFFKCSHPSSSSPISETQLSDDQCEIRKNFSSLEVCNHRGDVASLGLSNKSNSAYSNIYLLQQEVERLEQELQDELELHAILENAIQQNAVDLSTSLCLPHHAQDLLSNIAILESTVSKLEQEFISLRFQLSQERNERRLAEYQWRNSSSQLLFISSDEMKAPISSPLWCSKHSMSELLHFSEDISCQQVRGQPSKTESDSCIYQTIENAEKNVSMKMDTNFCHHVDVGKLTRELQHKDLCCYPNKLSEEMVRCMKNIFITLTDSITPSKSSAPGSHCSSLSPSGHLSNLSMWSLSDRSMISSWVQSPKIDLQSNPDVLAMENTYDPYRVSGKLSWADIGSYKLATEVSWMSVGEKQLEHAAEALRGFRTLVDQLAKVNPIHLSCDEKLAFWINIYNALIMHAYLAYGVPKSDLKLFSLMQKAAYTIGGHSFSAAAIEYVILKMKPPVHRPQIALLLALHKLKVSNEQRDCSIDKCEPLVAFALSCGMYSSPAVRIYSAQNVREELQEAQLDFIRASVGVSSKGKLLVPKMLHCFAKGLVDDAKLAVWIAHFLPPNQAAFVEKCISKRRGLLGSCNCGILPFDSRFRYLFLTENFSVMLAVNSSLQP